MRTFFSGQGNNPTDMLNYYMALSQNSSAANQTLGASMINDEHKKLLQDYFFNENRFEITTVAGQQFYPLPYNYSKLKTGTLKIGDLQWTPNEVLSRRDWDRLNTQTNYPGDIPNNFFIYNGKFGLWPTPATTGNIITFNYKIRVPDLTFADYTTGTVTTTDTQGVTSFEELFGGSSGYTSTVGVATTGGSGTGCTVTTTCVNGVISSMVIDAAGSGYSIDDNLFIAGGDGTANFIVNGISQSATITGSGTSWLTNYLNTTGNVQNLNLWLRINAPLGDNNWYQIQSISTNTSLTLINPYQGEATTGATYVIGQMPLLLEDFQDIPVYTPLIIYFSTINKNPAQVAQFTNMRERGIKMLDDYCGSKSLNVNLATQSLGENPNLYMGSFGQLPTN